MSVVTQTNIYRLSPERLAQIALWKNNVIDLDIQLDDLRREQAPRATIREAEDALADAATHLAHLLASCSPEEPRP